MVDPPFGMPARGKLFDQPSTYLSKLLEIFSSFFYNFFPLICEHNLICRCSKIPFHDQQILYLGSSCSKISLGFFPNFGAFRIFFMAQIVVQGFL
jgi:hypothetical protein